MDDDFWDPEDAKYRRIACLVVLTFLLAFWIGVGWLVWAVLAGCC